MRKSDPGAYEAYTNTRKEMQAEHDTKLKDYIEALPGFTDKEVKIQTVGTEGGIDRDYRALVKVPDPRDPSKSMWIEVPLTAWRTGRGRNCMCRRKSPTPRSRP